MKRFWIVSLILTILITLLSSCNTAQTEATTTTECNHNWQRTSNRNESTAVDKCTKCGETRFYTDPDSLPIGYRFTGSLKIAKTENPDETHSYSNQTILSILNRSHWEKVAALAADYDYHFIINDTVIEYSSASGYLINQNDERFQQLKESERLLINGLLDNIFSPTIADYIIEEDEDVFLVLPKSKTKLDLYAYQDHLDRIDLHLLKIAEDTLEKTIAEYPDPYESVSEFFLQTDDDGNLCLAVELIVIIDPPTEENASGCGIDHNHTFILERISK